MRAIISWKVILIGFHFDIRDNRISNVLPKFLHFFRLIQELQENGPLNIKPDFYVEMKI